MGNPFRWMKRRRDAPEEVRDTVSAAPTFLFGASQSGETVNEQSAMQVNTVYACVRVISETVASLPMNVYELDAKGGRRVAMDHPLEYLLHDAPNEEMTSFTWREQMLTQLLIHGNSYSQIVRNGKREILSLYPLLSSNMTVDRDDGGRLTYEYQTTNGGLVRMDPSEVLHIPGMGFDGVMGYSPIALMKGTLGLAMAAEKYGNSFFKNGATPGGVLMHPNRPKDLEKIRQGWNNTYGGSENSGKVAILYEGMKFERIALPNSEAQFLETRQFQTEEICRMYRVPPHMVSDLSHATFSNIEHQSIDFAVHTIRPWLVRIEQTVNKTLFGLDERGKYMVKINVDGLMRGDYKSRMEGYAIARQNGWMSANDIRELEDQNPISDEEGGNKYLVNGNMIPIAKAASPEGEEEENA